MHQRPASRPRLVVGCALVALFTMLALRGPASGASDQALPPDAARAVLPPAPLPSLAAPMPSVPLPLPSIPIALPSSPIALPSVDAVSPLPSASLPLPTPPVPSVPVPSVPVPSVPVPSVPVPSLSPLPSASLPVPTGTASPYAASTSEPTGTSGPEGASLVSAATAPALGRPDGPVDGRRRGAGVVNDRRPPTTVGRGGPEEPESASPAWTVPALAFGVPLMLVVVAVVAQLVGGAAVLGAARRMLSRLPGPAPRWMRGASDASEG